jgi:hypothetical protein
VGDLAVQRSDAMMEVLSRNAPIVADVRQLMDVRLPVVQRTRERRIGLRDGAEMPDRETRTDQDRDDRLIALAPYNSTSGGKRPR